MSRKIKYCSPVNVKNPISLQHLARVHPAQDIHLTLDEDLFPNPTIEVSSDKLIMGCTVNSTGSRCIHIRQTEDIEDWSDYSSVLLGEIWIGSDKTIARVLVMLECQNPIKQTFFTVINPDCCDARMRPGDILEVVLFDHDFGFQEEWTWQWTPMTEVGVELLGHSDLSLNKWGQKDHPDQPYARLARTEAPLEKQWIRQRHYWFRFNKVILDLMDQGPGTKHLGTFKFVGYADRYHKDKNLPVEYHLSVHVDVKERHRLSAIRSLLLPKLDGYPYQRPITQAIVHCPKVKERQKSKFVREVEVTLMDLNGFDDGCRLAPIVPDEKDAKSKVILDECCPYDDVTDDGPLIHYNHNQGNNNLQLHDTKLWRKHWALWD